MSRPRQIVLSPFILFDRDTGEAIWYECPPCPKCGFKMCGELAGAFECEICGFAELPKYAYTHGIHLAREGLWKFLYMLLKHTNQKVINAISELLSKIWLEYDFLCYQRWR